MAEDPVTLGEIYRRLKELIEEVSAVKHQLDTKFVAAELYQLAHQQIVQDMTALKRDHDRDVLELRRQRETDTETRTAYRRQVNLALLVAFIGVLAAFGGAIAAALLR
jgi:hypothetical protein